MTEQTPTPTTATARSSARDAALLSDGSCPFCTSRLRPLTAAEATDAQRWYSPPIGWCPTCLGWIGEYDGDVFVGYGPLRGHHRRLGIQHADGSMASISQHYNVAPTSGPAPTEGTTP